MIIEDRIPQDGSEIIVEIDSDLLYLRIVLELPQGARVVLEDGTFPALKSLSASLAASLSFGTAAELLARHAVPKDSDLWDLNHSNPWRR